MVKHALDATFAALSDPIRRDTVQRLAEGEATLGELAAPYGITLAGMLKHVRTLERAGLVEARKEGRTRICRLVPGPLRGAMSWLLHYRHFWQAQLDSLDRYLTDPSWTAPSTTPSSSGAPTRRRRPASLGRGRTRKR